MEEVIGPGSIGQLVKGARVAVSPMERGRLRRKSFAFHLKLVNVPVPGGQHDAEAQISHSFEPPPV
jgi:hypothetical protein